MVINALNSGAKVFMADFEDSLSPTWENLIEGQKALYLANYQCFTFAKTCTVLPLYEIKFPAIVPLRLKALFNYWLKKKVVLLYKPDVIYAHSPESALPFLIGKKNVPVVFHQHGSFNPVENTDIAWARNRLFKSIFNLILKFIYTRADAIIAIDKICYSQATKSGAARPNAPPAPSAAA